MDWLADNIIGYIPDIKDLCDEAVPMVKIQGIHESKEGI